MRNESSADRSGASATGLGIQRQFGHECIRDSRKEVLCDQRPATNGSTPHYSKPSPASASSSFTENFLRRHYLSTWAIRHSSQFQETRRVATTTSSKQCQQSSSNPHNGTALKVSFRRQTQHHQLTTNRSTISGSE